MKHIVHVHDSAYDNYVHVFKCSDVLEKHISI